MGSAKAFLLMALLTGLVGLVLYSLDAHLHHRNLVWAILLSVVLLATHVGNMAIYFVVADKNPYKWFN
jgi:hypothetical protein